MWSGIDKYLFQDITVDVLGWTNYLQGLESICNMNWELETSLWLGSAKTSSSWRSFRQRVWPMSGGDLHKPNDKAQGLFQVVLRNKSMWMMVYPKGMNNTVKAKIQITQYFYCYANEVKLELMAICRGQLRVLSWHPSTSSPSFIYKKKTKNLKFLRGMNNFVVNCTWDRRLEVSSERLGNEYACWKH